MRAISFAALVLLFAADAAAQRNEATDDTFGDLPTVRREGRVTEQADTGPVGPRANAMFTAIDADGDGVLTTRELRKAFAALKTLDSDRDGNITLAEVSGGGPGGAVGDPTQFADRMMKHDKNNDDMLSPDEVPRNEQALLQNADQDGDGQISRAELVNAAQVMQNRMQAGQGGINWTGGAGGVAPGIGRGGDPTGQFMQFDANRDGRLSPQEIPPQFQRSFRPSDDQNGDGTLDARELQIVIARMGGRARAFGADPRALNRGRPPVRNQNQ